MTDLPIDETDQNISNTLPPRQDLKTLLIGILRKFKASVLEGIDCESSQYLPEITNETSYWLRVGICQKLAIRRPLIEIADLENQVGSDSPDSTTTEYSNSSSTYSPPASSLALTRSQPQDVRGIGGHFAEAGPVGSNSERHLRLSI